MKAKDVKPGMVIDHDSGILSVVEVNTSVHPVLQELMTAIDCFPLDDPEYEVQLVYEPDFEVEAAPRA